MHVYLPTTETGLAARDNWVDVLSRHFADRVDYWAMWNEPDNNRKVNTPARVAAFNLRTAKIIRRNRPKAKWDMRPLCALHTRFVI